MLRDGRVLQNAMTTHWHVGRIAPARAALRGAMEGEDIGV